LKGDLADAGPGLGGLVDAAHLGDSNVNALLGQVDILPAQPIGVSDIGRMKRGERPV
jgi:hypothetical protein